MERIVLYASLGALLSAYDVKWDSAEFWCILGLFWVSEVINRFEGAKTGAGRVLELSMWQIARIKSQIERLDREQSKTAEQELADLEATLKNKDKHDDQQ